MHLRLQIFNVLLRFKAAEQIKRDSGRKSRPRLGRFHPLYKLRDGWTEHVR